MSSSFPYLDEIVPTPPNLDYRSWLEEAAGQLPFMRDPVADVRALATSIAAPMLGEIASLGAGLGGGPIGGAIAAGGFVASVLGGLFGGSPEPPKTKPIAGFPADVMQRNPLKNSNTAVAAGKLLSGTLKEGSGLRRTSVETEAMAKLNTALRAYASGGMRKLEDELGDSSSWRACSLFVATTNIPRLTKWLHGHGLMTRAKYECLARMLDYGAPRLQVREVLFYRGLFVLYLWMRERESGIGSLLDLSSEGRAMKALGPDVLVNTAKYLAVPIPTRYGKIWTFNALKPSIVSDELAFYRSHKIAGSYAGHFFELEPKSVWIENALSTVTGDYKLAVEESLDAMRSARKGTLTKAQGTKLETQARKKIAAATASAGVPGPVVAAGIAAAGLGAIWAWKKYGR